MNKPHWKFQLSWYFCYFFRGQLFYFIKTFDLFLNKHNYWEKYFNLISNLNYFPTVTLNSNFLLTQISPTEKQLNECCSYSLFFLWCKIFCWNSRSHFPTDLSGPHKLAILLVCTSKSWSLVFSVSAYIWDFTKFVILEQYD